nr:uroporphyrinogen-III C-methyltransferase [Anaerobutyricum sp.]
MVYLIGAGPGDPGLITYKGLQILKSCDAVIYDRLGTGELLDLVRPDCAKIYVGKQAGAHYKKQEEINRILVETAGKYEKVVRLKGGDSFVFGRGGEEILTLQEADIPF